MSFKVGVSVVCDSPNCKREYHCTAVGFNYIPKNKALEEAEFAGWYTTPTFARCPECVKKFVDDLVLEVYFTPKD